MIWDARHKLLLAALIIALAGAGVIFKQWLDAHDAQLKAEATVSAQKTNFDKAVETIKQLQESDAARAAQAASKVQIIREQGASEITPEQIAAYVTKAIGSQTPIQTVVPQATPENPKPQENLVITPEQQGILKNYATDCEACKVQRDALRASVTSKDEQIKQAGEELSAVSKERDAWKIAAKGSFWTRTKTALKYVGIGAGIGAIAVCGSGHCK